MNNDTLIVIPIRMASSRLPGKPLIDINGKTMVAHVWEKAILSKCGDVIVACCDKEARDYLHKKNIPYVMTKKKLNSGTDRVYNAMNTLLKKKKGSMFYICQNLITIKIIEFSIYRNRLFLVFQESIFFTK